jgi:L-lactate dehydrogenase complex protein LldE
MQASDGPKVRIALLVTCLADTMWPKAAEAARTVLERLGHEVVAPARQACCGQMHMNAGYPRQARRLARHLADVFADEELIVAPSSSCVGTIRELYPTLLGASEPVSNVFEFSELLVNHFGVEDVGARFPHRVAYHPTCHSLRVTQVGDAPLRLLRHVRDLELVEFDAPTECCGFGGTFAIKNAATSSAILADKCDNIERSGAEVCAALDSSCLLQIGGGLSRRHSSTRVMHLAEILAQR